MDDLVRIGRALSDGTRLAVLRLLGPDGMTAPEITRQLGIVRSTALHHLDLLVEAGLAERVDGVGRARIYRWPAERLVLVRFAGSMTGLGEIVAGLG